MMVGRAELKVVVAPRGDALALLFCSKLDKFAKKQAALWLRDELKLQGSMLLMWRTPVGAASGALRGQGRCIWQTLAARSWRREA